MENKGIKQEIEHIIIKVEEIKEEVIESKDPLDDDGKDGWEG
jgi:hypothetical protein